MLTRAACGEVVLKAMLGILMAKFSMKHLLRENFIEGISLSHYSSPVF
jgi:hypothetical protein